MISKLYTRKSTDLHFPALYKDTESDLVVMFIDLTNGIVLVGNSNYEIGKYKDNWIKCDCKSEWTLLDSSYVVKLANR
jgi:hypothetical protein